MGRLPKFLLEINVCATHPREVYRYGTNGEVRFDAKLFAKPEGVKIEDSQ